MKTVEQEYLEKKKLEKRKACKHQYILLRSNGKFQCCDCDKEFKTLPKNHRFSF